MYHMVPLYFFSLFCLPATARMLLITVLMLLGSDFAAKSDLLSGLAILLELKTHWSMDLSAWAVE